MLPFRYHSPESLPDLVALLDGYGADARPLAGGTDLTVGLRNGTARPGAVVDLKRVAALRPEIVETDGHLRMSANVSMTDLVRSEPVRRHVPALVEAAMVVGSRQIRNRATLAGNVCNASPAADTVPVLACHDARISIAGPEGEREMPIAAFILGNRRTDLRRGEVVTAVTLPIPSRAHGAAFGRITRRRGHDLAIVNLCAGATAEGSVRMVLGAAAPIPLVIDDETGILGDPGASEDDRADAIDAVIARATPITDVRASREYRIGMLKVLARRTLARALDRRELWEA